MPRLYVWLLILGVIVLDAIVLGVFYWLDRVVPG